MISRAPFGNTGHHSSRVIFGAAALAAMRPARAEELLESLLSRGVNHIDTAARYGDSELRVGEWMAAGHRERFFLATKTGDRTAEGARESLHRSLERLQTDHLDLLQLHNLVDEEGWQTAMSTGGALEALLEAREQGLVRFLGVTGHGTYAPAMHLRSLERHAFDAVLLPYNFSMMQSPQYAADFEALAAACDERGVALQTIKAIARRRWRDQPERRFSWYEPIRDGDAIRRLVHFVLARPAAFLNTTSDARLLPQILDAAEAPPGQAPSETDLADDAARLDIEPLFVRDVAEGV